MACDGGKVRKKAKLTQAAGAFAQAGDPSTKSFHSFIRNRLQGAGVRRELHVSRSILTAYIYGDLLRVTLSVGN